MDFRRGKMVACGLVVCGALVLVGLAAASTSVDLAGTWNCCGSGGAAAQTWKITSVSASGALKGSGGGGSITFPITGTVSGNSVSLTTGPYTQLPSYSATFKGKVASSGKTMSGSWTSNAHQSGTWSATLTTPLKKFKKPTKPKKPKKPTKPKKPKTSTTKGKGKGGNKISITGPVANVFHTDFDETVSGVAVSPANYLISGEQLYPTGGCSSSYTTEAKKSDWYQWTDGGVEAVHGKFSSVAHFYARNHNAHGICSYLINSSTRKTYAYAARWWDNS